MKLWAITAQRLTKDGEWTGNTQVPTFYLHPAVQGIVSIGGAVAVAEDILGPDGRVLLAIEVEVDG